MQRDCDYGHRFLPDMVRGTDGDTYRDGADYTAGGHERLCPGYNYGHPDGYHISRCMAICGGNAGLYSYSYNLA